MLRTNETTLETPTAPNANKNFFFRGSIQTDNFYSFLTSHCMHGPSSRSATRFFFLVCIFNSTFWQEGELYIARTHSNSTSSGTRSEMDLNNWSWNYGSHCTNRQKNRFNQNLFLQIWMATSETNINPIADCKYNYLALFILNLICGRNDK